MNEYTPYRGLLIYHGTGVGKTCTSITIAENIKKMVIDNNKKIHIIRYEEFKNQIFDMNKLKQNKLKEQCTRDTYVKELIKNDKNNKDLIEKCKENHIYCNSIYIKLNKLIKSYYDFKNVEKWARDTNTKINKKNKNIDEKTQHINKINTIRKEFSNSVIIIDEAHHIHSKSNNSDIKLISSVLHDVLKYGLNIRIILLTATPLWDRPSDIISLLNYLLINDKRCPLKLNDIFDSKEKLINEPLLREKMNGYISYLRGENPFTFPIRLDAKHNVPEQLIKKYPINLIKDSNYTELSNNNIKFEIFNIIDAQMSKEQKKVYNKIIKLNKDKEEFSTVWATETQISNFIYQTLEDANNDINNCYGENGFKSITNKNNNGSYTFKDEMYGLNLLMDKIHIYSKKIALILKNIEKSDGPVFIFSKYVWGGLCPIILALEMNGYRRYKSHNNPFLNNKYKSSDYKGDYIIRSGSIKSSNINDYIGKKQNMINENVKVFLGTTTASEGLSLFGYREVHVLEPHFNFSLIEQVIGRTLRNKSHFGLPINKRNVSVYLYASTNGKDESVDLFKYRISEIKAKLIGKIERILKESAIDCYLNYYGNHIFSKNNTIKIITSHNKFINYTLGNEQYTRICNYSKDCNYICNKEKDTLKYLQNNETNTNNGKHPILITNIKEDIDIMKKQIITIILDNYIIKINDIKKIIKLKPVFEDIYNMIIMSIIKENKTYNNKGDLGKIILYNNYIKFISLKNGNPDIEYTEQYYDKFKSKRINEIDMRFYINKLKDENKEKEQLELITYNTIFDKFKLNFDKIKFKLNKNKYMFSLQLSDYETIIILFTKLIFDYRLIIIKNLLLKQINKYDKFNRIEQNLLRYINLNNIITLKEITDNIFLKKKKIL